MEKDVNSSIQDIKTLAGNLRYDCTSQELRGYATSIEKDIKNIESYIQNLSTSDEALPIGSTVKLFCVCKEKPSCRRQDNKYYCNTCDREVK